ncbi:MAG: phosphate transport system protein [Candidatus Saganbacteria bacterium]|uniref:Phosphate-specific transport system accessory protein PhoU n=1 Tax=Candidatus Saganbacteria bacterium TaxID=2575572 RepID=A0A833L350_UNCSA|nr:MAG: phosphate transport system protein [Candidatus Saganbacteria bacterium]
MEHQYTAYDQELASLKDSILKMGGLVEELIFKSIESLKNRDRNLAKEVIKQDVAVDRLELEIDEQCINLIALRQPKAGDLRFITTGMRIATDLERIGDLAEDIAERSLELADQGPLKPLIDIPKMAELAQAVLRAVLDAFVNGDTAKLKGVWDKEREIDGLRDQVHDELISIMVKDSLSVPRAIPLLLISRHLERIADHATNIAEDVVFMVEAKVVKHGGGEKA